MSIRVVVAFIVTVLSKESSAKALTSHELARVSLLTSLTSINVRIYGLQDVSQLRNVVQVRNATQVWHLSRLPLVNVNRLAINVESQRSLQAWDLRLGTLCGLVGSLWVLVGVFVNQIFFFFVSAYNIFFVILFAVINARVLSTILFKFSFLIGAKFVLGSLVCRLLMLLPDAPIV